jgi:hypothetical protein
VMVIQRVCCKPAHCNDASGELVWVCIGAPRTPGDAGVYNRSSIARKVFEGTLRQMFVQFVAGAEQCNVSPTLQETLPFHWDFT